MDHNFPMRDLSPCEWVDHIINGLPLGEEPFFLWLARTHAISCIVCQQRHPNATAFLSDLVRQQEAALVFEVEKVRGSHIQDASTICREAILARPSGAIFPLDEVLLSSRFEEESDVPRDVAFTLVASLARAGRRIKKIFATAHGEGLAWFNVVPNLDDAEEESAWKECAGLVRQLSIESREFAFSAALAAELLPDLAWDPDKVRPEGLQLGVLYKAIQAAASRYVVAYLAENVHAQVLSTPELDHHPPPNITEELLPNIRHLNQQGDSQTESLVSGQTAMMGSLSEIEKALRELLQKTEKTSDAAKRSCEATVRAALGSQFDQLEESTRTFLRTAEYGYTTFPNDLDFSPVVVGLTKVFEVEFRRVIQPFVDQLQQLAIRDVSFNGELTTFTLGAFNSFFRKHQPIVERLFRQHGLECESVCRAISQVNKEKAAKHLGKVTKADATRFRALFIGSPSILAALRPNP